MTKNPLLNALAASAYIVLVASVMYYGSKLPHHPDTVLAPIAFISLFSLSAAVMGYLFLSQPLQLYLAGKKQPAIKLFLQTLTAFAVLTILILIILFSGLLP